MDDPQEQERQARREASGWGRRPPRPSDVEPGRQGRVPEAAGDPAADPAGDPARDLAESAAAGAISGRAVTRAPQELAPGDTLGGIDEEEAPGR